MTYKCLNCNGKLKPTEDNPNYFMCYACIKGWSREELELSKFVEKYLEYKLLPYQLEIVLSLISKLGRSEKVHCPKCLKPVEEYPTTDPLKVKNYKCEKCKIRFKLFEVRVKIFEDDEA